MCSVKSTAAWSLALSLLALGGIAQSRPKSDPSDDFSFEYQSQSGTYSRLRVMPFSRVQSVFEDRLRGVPSPQIAPLARHLVEVCRQHRFDPALVLSLMEVESGFQNRAISPKGARGLLQLRPSTAQDLARQLKLSYTDEDSLHDPFLNVSLGVAYLAQLRSRFADYSPYFHIAAYNVGPSRLRELMKRPHFRPTQTAVYFEKIRKGVHRIRHYDAQAEAAARLASRMRRRYSKTALTTVRGEAGLFIHENSKKPSGRNL